VVGRRSVGQVVRGDDDGPPGGPLRGDHVDDVLAGHDVEAGDRLVEEEHVGLLREALRDEGPLALPARELVELAVGEVRDGEGLHGLVDGSPVRGPQPTERAGAGVPAHRHGLPDGDGELRVHLGGLEDVGDAAGALGGRHVEVPVAGVDPAADRVEEGGLPGAVRPDERGDGAVRDLERGVVQHHPGPVAEAEGRGAGGGRGRGVQVSSDLRMITRLRTFPSMRTVLSRAAGVGVGALLLAAAVGCGVGGDDDRADGGGPRIVVTTNVLGDVVTQLVGDDAAVEVLMPPGANPHDLAPSPRQAAAMRSADLLVVNGRGFEEGLLDAIEAAEADGVPVVAAADGLGGHDHEDHDDDDQDDDDQDDDHGHDGHDGHDHDADAHFFVDPVLMAEAVEHLAAELAEHVPALDADALAARAEAYAAELDALHHEVEEILAAVPAERRLLVTHHDVLGFFADRYGFEVLGVVIPGGSTLAAASAAELAELADAIADAGVPAIFADTSARTRLVDSLAGEGAGVEVVELFTESLGEAGSGADTYVGMVRTNAERIAAALAG